MVSADHRERLLGLLKQRFDVYASRLHGLEWSHVEARLLNSPEKLVSLYEMEKTGGEPALVAYDESCDQLVFVDCAPESPSGRRSLCYDGEAMALRLKKGVRPKGNVVDMAAAMGVEVLTEEQYRWLQTIGEFDTRTSSWLKTPASVRKLGGALFGERRYNTVFVCANSAPSFYGSRGFRALLKV
ncbi:MAG: DUF4256 domain-containing protein [Thaumarchaeota archaeon]|nr:DUF4256 domain-containing protein [Candidatus Calditenuaceae archaeon]